MKKSSKHLGIAVSNGYGLGNAYIVNEPDLFFEEKRTTSKDAEISRFSNALNDFKKQIHDDLNEAKSLPLGDEIKILEGQSAIADDPSVYEDTLGLISKGLTAEAAIGTICDKYISLFSQMEDEIFSQRAFDVKDFKTRILHILLRVTEPDISALNEKSVLITKELTPSLAGKLSNKNIAGVITQAGGKNGHAAIILRSLEIPAVFGVDDIINKIAENDYVILDGCTGDVFIMPDALTINEYNEKKYLYLQEKEEYQKFAGKETKTSDNVSLKIYCNMESEVDVPAFIQSSAEGVGLFRTEFLYLNSSSPLSEDHQFEIYKRILLAAKDKEVIIRTADLGADKSLDTALTKKENNPFMGQRGIRYSLNHKEMFKAQLKALLRAGIYGNLKIMLPLICTYDEVLETKALILECKNTLSSQNIPYKENLSVGIMVETAAASVISDILSGISDFFSIGSNDLAGYTMSADRTNPYVSDLCSVYEPAVLRSIKNIIINAKNAGIPVGLCGEAAGDLLLTPLFIAYGLEEFSVSPTNVLSLRAVISKWSVNEAKEVEKAVSKLNTRDEVEKYLKSVKR
mgnify:FL=1